MRIVCKFGGSSLASYREFKKVKKILNKDKDRDVVVVSAMGKNHIYHKKVTDELIDLFETKDAKIFYRLKKRYSLLVKKTKANIDLEYEFNLLERRLRDNDYDKVVAFGEYLCAKIFASYLNFEFVDATKLIYLDSNKNLNESKTKQAFERLVEKHNIVIPGFYGSTNGKDIVLLNRGGSDFSGAIACKYLGGECYENYSDVDGVYLCNPKIIKNKSHEKEISLVKLQRLVENGTQLLNLDCIKFLNQCKIVVKLKNTFAPYGRYTNIQKEQTHNNFVFSGFAYNDLSYFCVVCNKSIFKRYNDKYIFDIEYIEEDVFTFKSKKEDFKRVYRSLYRFLKKYKKKGLV